jgi:hypothetical protein
VGSRVCPFDNIGVNVDSMSVAKKPDVDVSDGGVFPPVSFLTWQAEKRSRQDIRIRKLLKPFVFMDEV